MAGEAGAPPRDARTGAKPAVEQRVGSALRAALALAVLLMLVGVAGGGALKLLRYAMRTPTADDTAQIICTAYRQQNYDLLLQRIDSTPVPPANTGAFDANALRARLQVLDTSQGTVSSCAYRQLDFGTTATTPGALQYTFAMRRARAANEFDLIMTLIYESDGTWKVSRASNFTGLPA
ncbi:MAG: hypothetical protein IVW57_15810 [Ktedonobacterales bacterium]|nr:hypothetical protein [Ktedonobacterales bacterium]